MQFIDMHCDSLMKLMANPENTDLYDSPVTSVDFKRMKEGGQMAQFFAIFMLPEEAWKMVDIDPVSDEDYIAGCRNILNKNLEKYAPFAAPAETASEIEANYSSGKPSAVLTMEDGRAVLGKMENLERFYDMGVRAIALTWNYENCFGFPNSADAALMQKGLKPFGKEAVEYMQELGILVDVSHLSDGGFYDVADICRKPFAATHSNCRALSPHQRNLTDEMIRILGDAGGVSGINFSPNFLNEDITAQNSTAFLMAKHARHMADTGGIECVGLGSDLDGIEGDLEVYDCAQLWRLEDALIKEGFSSSEIEKIFYKNVLRVMKDAIG